jgi:hypothetical protein
MSHVVAMLGGAFLNQADHAVAARTDQSLNFVMPCHGLGTGNLAIKTTQNARLYAHQFHLETS